MLGGASWAAMAMTHIRNLPQRDVGTAAGLKAATHRMSFKASASILQIDTGLRNSTAWFIVVGVGSCFQKNPCILPLSDTSA